ncbi:MAG: acylphosphatase [Ignavibacteria bacterium]|nr:acylphosphatase [Ignavibacteria bacterium]
MKSLLLTVKGVVQGVGFRYFCYKQAVIFGITGYAKNLHNGDVEILAQGSESALNAFIREVKTGPRYSSVNSVSIRVIEACEISGDFSIV